MSTQLHIAQQCQSEITLILCEACFDVLLECDTEYIDNKALCHRCLREECQ
ncbi:MAG TPA: hypothetical protein HPP94_09455 [Desulfuromonadales bacterium]|nr:hypothetical protein [Desulfuromonadales bacterium]